jgi:hypothetical protein
MVLLIAGTWQVRLDGSNLDKLIDKEEKPGEIAPQQFSSVGAEEVREEIWLQEDGKCRSEERCWKEVGAKKEAWWA